MVDPQPRENNMSKQLRSVVASLSAVAALSISTSAFAADGHITYLKDVGTPEQPLLIAGSDRGVVFIDANATLYRAFHHEQATRDGVSQPMLWVEDIDGDRVDEYVGAGSPSFVIESNGDPLWGVAEGCEQYFVGDFIDDNSVEIFCRSGNSMRVWSYDGQPYFEWSSRGFNIENCYSDDFDSDRKAEVACALSNGNHLMFDIEYDGPEENDGPVPEVENRGGVSTRNVASAAAGERTVTLGTEEVTLRVGDAITEVLSGEAMMGTIAVAGPIFSAFSADLDGDGSEELYLGGADVVHVVSADRSVRTVLANPNNVTRTAQVELRNATANGLEASDRESVRAVVDAQMPTINGCYASRMGADQFTRVGTMLFELSIDSDGDVADATQRHSDLRNDSLERCVRGALEDLQYSPATNGNGISSVSLNFTFVDAQ
ncbi:MAG: hypothetical protein ACI81R_001486 [Bradymonadia bacterium]|jgi:hypothetical protein